MATGGTTRGSETIVSRRARPGSGRENPRDRDCRRNRQGSGREGGRDRERGNLEQLRRHAAFTASGTRLSFPAAMPNP